MLAAPIGLLHRARKYAIFFAVATVTGIAVAYGIEPARWLISQTPVLAGLKNGRMILIASFGLAVVPDVVQRIATSSPFVASTRLS